jgi:uncharacterized protein YbjT (DUF2867 family)
VSAVRVAVAGGTGLTGRHVRRALEAAGHAAVPLSRAGGVDLISGTGLDGALAGMDAVIDVTNVKAQSRAKAVEFFGSATRNLLAAERRAGVGHHVALSIVGVGTVDYAYYAGKAHQEELISAGAVPWSIVRATQFHEFAEQVLDRVRGLLIPAPRMLSQPIAVREVGAFLGELAVGAPAGPVGLAGPREEQMVDMIRQVKRLRRRRGVVIPVRLPGRAGRQMAEGGLLPTGPGPRGRQTFADWLAERARAGDAAGVDRP